MVDAILTLQTPIPLLAQVIARRSLIQARQVLGLPKIAGNRRIGILQGCIFTVPTRCSTDLIAINPLTKSHLPLPSTVALPALPVSNSNLSLFLGKRAVDRKGNIEMMK